MTDTDNTDVFSNLDAMSMSQNFVEMVGGYKPLIDVPVRKPAKEWWLQVHPDPKMTRNFYMIELSEKKEQYFVVPSVAAQIPEESTLSGYTFFTCQERDGIIFLWPIKIGKSGDKPCKWHDTARECAERAKKNWVRVQANMHRGCYDITETTMNWDKVDWSRVPSLDDLLRIAFPNNSIIKDMQHDVIKRLRGLV